MATSTQNTSRGAAPPSMENSIENYERERVFGLFRQFGYLEAELNPLGLLPPQPHPDLEIDNEWAREARRIYCGSVGVEFMHIADPERRRWIQEQIEEKIEAQPSAIASDRERALDLLMRAELLEQTLQARYLGNKRFSLEGSTSLLPFVDEVLDVAGERGAVELVMGMSHRGRLNVMVHVARRPAEQVFAEFEDVDPRSVLGSGDVKYHMGATGEYITRSRKENSYPPGVEPQPPRSGESGDGGAHSRQAGPRRRRRQGKVSAAAGAWRRRVCGARHHGGDAELCRSRRLHGGRNDPRHRQQPDRVHDQCPRRAFLALLGATGAAAGDSDFSCEWRRRGCGDADRAHRHRVPLQIRRRRGRGLDRLPAPRA